MRWFGEKIKTKHKVMDKEEKPFLLKKKGGESCLWKGEKRGLSMRAKMASMSPRGGKKSPAEKPLSEKKDPSREEKGKKKENSREDANKGGGRCSPHL